MAYTTIKKPSSYFNTVLYSGDGTSGRTISGVGFQADMLWLKDRASVGNHALTDSVRGGNVGLRPNLADAESAFGSLNVTFTSDGFTNSGTTFNTVGINAAAWNWKAGGTGVSNTDGSITSTVSANTTSGFSIVSYTGTGANATVGHGLGVAPNMYIVKNRSDNDSWGVYHKSLGATKFLRLQGTDASATSSVWWNDTEPTSSVFSVGTAVATNSSSENLIAYCFAEKKGFSKFGSYTGNGNADGTFIYTGFTPAFVMIKQTSSAGEGWEMGDNKRSTYNVITTFLRGNSSGAESTNTDRQYDFLSNGIKMRGSHGSTNGSGQTYIYMAFAAEPLVGDNPATAR